MKNRRQDKLMEKDRKERECVRQKIKKERKGKRD